MPTLRIVDSAHTLTIDTPGPLLATHPAIESVLDAVQQLGAAVSGGMERISCEGTATPGVYLYKIKTTDGRVWKQEIAATGPDQGMTFDVPDPWRLSEFEPHRPLRAACLDLIANQGMTALLVVWT